MMVCSPISKCLKSVFFLTGYPRHFRMQNCGAVSQASCTSFCFNLSCGKCKLKYAAISSRHTFSCTSYIGIEAIRGSSLVKRMVNFKHSQRTCLDISLQSQQMNVRLSEPNQGAKRKIKCNTFLQGCVSASLMFGLLICNSNSEPVHAEEVQETKENKEDDCSASIVSHGKKVYTDYSVIGIPGDGRCLFRSVVHGACLRSGKPAPNEILQRELADNLRVKVADEFVKRRKETEWFIEGDFDSYVLQMRKPHVWGGEPELLMASHVIQMPITVYMYDQDSCGIISIAEYGQEYGKDNPIKVLYYGSGHYDALQIPGKKGARSRI